MYSGVCAATYLYWRIYLCTPRTYEKYITIEQITNSYLFGGTTYGLAVVLIFSLSTLSIPLQMGIPLVNPSPKVVLWFLFLELVPASDPASLRSSIMRTSVLWVLYWQWDTQWLSMKACLLFTPTPFFRDFGSRASYEVTSLSIEDSNELIFDKISLQSIFLGIIWSHCIGITSTMLREGTQAVARLSRYILGKMWKIL